MLIKSVWLAFFLLFPLSVSAYISSDGDSFDIKYNKHGAVLTSEFVKYRFQGSGAASEIVRKKAKIYLGKNCDVESEFYGKGTWSWETRGFFVNFRDHRLIFMGEVDIKECGPSWAD